MGVGTEGNEMFLFIVVIRGCGGCSGSGGLDTIGIGRDGILILLIDKVGIALI